jgi:hypothetical protein
MQAVPFVLTQDTIDKIILLFITLLGAYTTWKTSQTGKKVDAVQIVADATHKLSNSAMGEQLQIGVDDAKALQVVLQSKADASTQPGDAAAALAASQKVMQRQKLLDTHLANQSKVDVDLAAAKSGT